MLVILEGDHSPDFIVPQIVLHKHVLVLAVLFHFPKYVSAKYFVEFLSCYLITCNYILLLLGFKGSQNLAADFVFNCLAIVLYIFSSFVNSLEESHHVPQSNIVFHFVNVLKNLVSFDFALNCKSNLGPVHF